MGLLTLELEALYLDQEIKEFLKKYFYLRLISNISYHLLILQRSQELESNSF